MANIKFSEFTEATAIGDIAFVVGYDGSTNKRILATDLLGNYLPLAGGTMTGNTLHGDNVKSIYGAGGDLEIYHTGTHSIIKDAGTGNLQLNAGSFVLNNSGDTQNMIIAIDGGATTLFCAGVNRLATTSTGITVAGNGIFSGNVGIGTTNPGAKLQIGSATHAPNANLGNNLLQIKSPSGYAYLTIGNGDASNSTSYIGGASGFTVIGSVTDAGTLSEYMRITNTGNVGIGTSSPSDKLSVVSTVGIVGDGTNHGLLKLYCEAGTPHYVGLKGPNHSGGSSYTLQLPNTLPNVANQILESNTAGTLSWIATPGGGGGGATELNDLTDCFVATGASGGVSLATIPFSGSVGNRNTIIGNRAANFSTTSLVGATIMGHFAGYNQVGGNGSTYIGEFAGYNQTSTSSISNIFVGPSAGYGAVGASGSGNVGVGKDTMSNITSGSKNMAMGYRSLRFLESGSSNIAIGQDAGKGITTQWNNVCVGQETLENSNSSSCVAIGNQAMDTSSNVGGFCVAVGYQAGRNFVTQQGLIAMGYQASYSHTSGADCVTIGRSAGYSNTTGQHRAILGAFAAQYNTGSGNTAMGYNALKGPSSGTVNGGYNVAIGRNAMDVLTTGSFNTAIGNDSAENLQSGFFNTYLGRDSGTGHINGTNCTFVGNDSAPSTSGASNEIVLGNASISALRCQVTSITALSDRRDKTKIEDSNYGLNVIDKLKPVTFDWNTRDGAKVGVKDLGFIAQDLQEVDDENLKLVYDTNPEKLEASYGRLIPVLVKAIQELKAEIEILKS